MRVGIQQLIASQIEELKSAFGPVRFRLLDAYVRRRSFQVPA
jgi:hypothetical protein